MSGAKPTERFIDVARRSGTFLVGFAPLNPPYYAVLGYAVLGEGDFVAVTSPAN